eukprot:SAG11_NODE_1469_length_4850_cov_2.659651_2_plen_460_part_00
MTGLEAGTEYKLQMFYSEKCCNRGFDVLVDGEVVLASFSPRTVEGGINTLHTAAAVTYVFTATATSVTVTNIGNGAFPDNNPILAGLTLEQNPAASAGRACGALSAAEGGAEEVPCDRAVGRYITVAGDSSVSLCEVEVWGTALSTPADGPGDYVGCFVDGGNRALYGAGYSMGQPADPLQTCRDLCEGYHYFGLQWYEQCFCGDEYAMHGAAAETDCNTPCRGNTNIMCGGGWRNSVYEVVAEPAVTDTYVYSGPLADTYLPGCSMGCLAFSSLAECQTECSATAGCGGCTHEGPSNGHAWQWEMRAGTDGRVSPYGESSYLKVLTGMCREFTVEERCTNGVFDDGEVCVDGGALCGALGADHRCGDGTACSVDGDCESARCTSGVCVSCTDGVQVMPPPPGGGHVAAPKTTSPLSLSLSPSLSLSHTHTHTHTRARSLVLYIYVCINIRMLTQTDTH